MEKKSDSMKPISDEPVQKIRNVSAEVNSLELLQKCINLANANELHEKKLIAKSHGEVAR